MPIFTSKVAFSAFFELYMFSFAPFQISAIFQNVCTVFLKFKPRLHRFSMQKTSKIRQTGRPNRPGFTGEQAEPEVLAARRRRGEGLRELGRPGHAGGQAESSVRACSSGPAQGLKKVRCSRFLERRRHVFLRLVAQLKKP